MASIQASDYPTLNDAVNAAISQLKKLEIGPGNYVVTAPVTIPQNVRLVIEGFSAWDTKIDYTAINGPWLRTARSIKWLHVSGCQFTGIGEAFRQLTVPIPPATVAPANTGGFWTIWVHDCVFNHTGPAWSIQTPDSPHQLYERCLFLGKGDDARGIVVRGNPTNFVVRNCVFGNQLYPIALGCDGGGYFRFMDNEFFNFSPRPTVPTAHYWILPGTGAGGDGRGGRIRSNKHGNEYSDVRDAILLFADSDNTDLTIGKHLLTRSAGNNREIEIEDEQVATWSQTTPSIVCYSPNLTNCKFNVDRINNNRPIIGSGLDAAGVAVLTTAEVAALTAQVV